MSSLRDADRYVAQLERRTAALERDKRYEDGTRSNGPWTPPPCFAVLIAPMRAAFVLGAVLHQFRASDRLAQFLSSGTLERFSGTLAWFSSGCQLGFLVDAFRCGYDFLADSVFGFYSEPTLNNDLAFSSPVTVSSGGKIGTYENSTAFQIADPYSEAVVAEGNYGLQFVGPRLQARYGVPYRLSSGNILALHANNIELCDSRGLLGIYNSTMSSCVRVGNYAEYNGIDATDLKALASCAAGGFYSASYKTGVVRYSDTGTATQIVGAGYFSGTPELWSDYAFGDAFVITFTVGGASSIARYESGTQVWCIPCPLQVTHVRFNGSGDCAVTYHVSFPYGVEKYYAFIVKHDGTRVDTEYYRDNGIYYSTFQNQLFLDMDTSGPICSIYTRGYSPPSYDIHIKTFSMVDGTTVQNALLAVTDARYVTDLVVAWNGSKIYAVDNVSIKEWNRDGSKSMSGGVHKEISGHYSTMFCPINHGKDAIWFVESKSRISTSTWTTTFTGASGNYSFIGGEVFVGGEAITTAVSGANTLVMKTSPSTGAQTTLYSVDQSTLPSVYGMPPWSPEKISGTKVAITNGDYLAFNLYDLRKNYIRAALYASDGTLLSIYNAVSVSQQFSYKSQNLHGYVSSPECVYVIEHWNQLSTAYGYFRFVVYNPDLSIMTSQNFANCVYKNSRTNETTGSIVFSMLGKLVAGVLDPAGEENALFFSLSPAGSVLWSWYQPKATFGTPSYGIAFATLDISGTPVNVAVFGYVDPSGSKRLLFLDSDTGSYLSDCRVPYLSYEPSRVELHSSGALFVSAS